MSRWGRRVIQTRRVLKVFGIGMALVAAIAAARWWAVSSAQRQMVSETHKMVGGLSGFWGSLSEEGARAPSMPDLNLAGVQSSQFAVATAGSGTAMLSSAAVFVACLAVAYVSSSLLHPVLMALWGWVCNALAVAALSAGAFAMLGQLRLELSTISPQATATPQPFGVWLLAALGLTFVAQGLVPGGLGVLAGRGLRERKGPLTGSLSTRNESPPATQEHVARVRCASCDTLNLATSGHCYACAARLPDAHSQTA